MCYIAGTPPFHRKRIWPSHSPDENDSPLPPFYKFLCEVVKGEYLSFFKSFSSFFAKGEGEISQSESAAVDQQNFLYTHFSVKKRI